MRELHGQVKEMGPRIGTLLSQASKGEFMTTNTKPNRRHNCIRNQNRNPNQVNNEDFMMELLSVNDSINAVLEMHDDMIEVSVTVRVRSRNS